MTKDHFREEQAPDGRIGWPDALLYEITEGPDAGKRLFVPPTFATHPHPDPKALAQTKTSYIKASVAYRTVVLDPVAFDLLSSSGAMFSERHCGEREKGIDIRPAPGA